MMSDHSSLFYLNMWTSYHLSRCSLSRTNRLDHHLLFFSSETIVFLNFYSMLSDHSSSFYLKMWTSYHLSRCSLSRTNRLDHHANDMIWRNCCFLIVKPLFFWHFTAWCLTIRLHFIQICKQNRIIGVINHIITIPLLSIRLMDMINKQVTSYTTPFWNFQDQNYTADRIELRKW